MKISCPPDNDPFWDALIAKAPPSPRIDWGKAKLLPTTPASPAVDVAAINQRLAPWRDNPVRWLRGTFRVPVDISPEAYRKLRLEKVKAFLRAKQQQGWELASRIQVLPCRFPQVTEVEGATPRGGQREVIVRAQFRKLDFGPLRIPILRPAGGE